MATAKINREENGTWIRCPRCGHKLARVIGQWDGQNVFPALEIKCHSCKEISYIMIGGIGKDEAGTQAK